jgi:hypothetical protein
VSLKTLYADGPAPGPSVSSTPMTRLETVPSSASFNPRFNRDLARLFSAPVSRALATAGDSPLVRALVDAQAVSLSPDEPLSRLYEETFEYLWSSYRGAYCYANAVARRILIGRHSLRTTRMLSELRVGASKADVVLVNGTTTVYEIKTALDSLDRLASQLAAYCAVFDKVYVVTHPDGVARVRDASDPRAGILVLTDAGRFQTVREASSNRARIDRHAAFDVLRQSEYTRIVRDLTGRVPNVPNTAIYQACRRIIDRLSPAQVHDVLADALRCRAPASEIVALAETAPESLTALSLTAGFSAKEAQQFQARLKAPILLQATPI